MAIKEFLPSFLAIRHEGSEVVPKSSGDKDDFDWGLERFLDEARTLGRFKHDNIIQVYRFFRLHGTAYIVMEYAEGETVSALLRRKPKLIESELRKILMPIISGLEEVHRAHIWHRDIKPGNIIIRDDGIPERVWKCSKLYGRRQ